MENDWQLLITLKKHKLHLNSSYYLFYNSFTLASVFSFSILLPSSTYFLPIFFFLFYFLFKLQFASENWQDTLLLPPCALRTKRWKNERRKRRKLDCES